MARVRRATVRDLDVLVRHRHKMFQEISDATRVELNGLDRRYRRWARAQLRSGGIVAFIVVDERGRARASGVLWLMPLPPRPWPWRPLAPYLMAMYTEPESRGKGYATMVVDAAVRWAKARRYEVVTLHASDEGKGIYEKAGFRPTSEMRLRLGRASGTGGRRPPKGRGARRPRK